MQSYEEDVRRLTESFDAALSTLTQDLGYAICPFVLANSCVSCGVKRFPWFADVRRRQQKDPMADFIRAESEKRFVSRTNGRRLGLLGALIAGAARPGRAR